MYFYIFSTGEFHVPLNIMERGNSMARKRTFTVITIPQVKASPVKSLVSVDGRIVSVSIV